MAHTIFFGTPAAGQEAVLQSIDLETVDALAGSTPPPDVREEERAVEAIIVKQLLALQEEEVAAVDLSFAAAIDAPALETRVERLYDGSGLPVIAKIPIDAKYITPDGSEAKFTYTKLLTVVDGHFVCLAGDSERDPRSPVILEQIAHNEIGKSTLSLTDRGVLRPEGKFYPISEQVLSYGNRILLKEMEGGGGILKFAYDIDRKEIVVLKFAKRTGNDTLDAMLADGLRNEAKMLLKVFKDDPEIMESYGLEEIDGVPYLVMPYAEMNSGHLFASAKRKFETGDTMALTDAFYFVAGKLRDAIKKLHEKDVIYLDLKADNVLWKRDRTGIPQIKLIDFGTAITYEQARIRDNVSFTAETVEPQLLVSLYGAYIFGKGVTPEGASARRLDYEKQCDVYSYAATLEEMVADVLGVTLDVRYKGRIGENYIHPSFVFEKIAADRANIAALREANRSKGLFAEDVFDFIEQLKTPRVDRPDIEDIVDVTNMAGRQSFVIVKQPAIEAIDHHQYGFTLIDTKENRNYTIAKAILRAAEFIAINQDNGWIYGRVEGGESGAIPHIEFSDRMSIRRVKRFTDFAYLDPRFAEPEGFLTYEFPGLAPADQLDYWRKEQRIDIEAEAKLYETGMVVLRHMAAQLGVELKSKAYDRQEAKALTEKRLADLQNVSMDEVLAKMPYRGIAGYLAMHHRWDYAAVAAANGERGVYDPALLDIIGDMLQPRLERMRRVPFDTLRERAHSIMTQYKN